MVRRRAPAHVALPGRGRLLVLFVALAGLMLLAAGTASAQAPVPEVLVGHVSGPINPVVVGYVDRVISSAERSNAAAVVFDMDTPGGLSAAIQDVDARIRTARVPVIVCIPNAAVPSSPGVPACTPTTPPAEVLRQVDGEQAHLSAGDVVLHTAGATIRSADMSPGESLLLTITSPTIAYLLLTLGALGLLLELSHPGAIFPGVIGGTCLLLAYFALGSLPLNVAGLALIGLGLLLFGLEPYLTAHGLLAAGGTLAFVAGSLQLVNAPAQPYLHVSLIAIGAVTAVMLGFSLVVVTAVLRSRRRSVVTGREGMLGQTGIVRRELGPVRPGMVMLHGELWQAVAADGRAGAGERVSVERIEGLLLTVRRAPGTLSPAPRRPASPAMSKSSKAGV